MADGINGVLEQIIRQATVRHRVISSNIANVDTPGYKAKDVSFAKVLGNELGMATTSPKHLQAAGSTAGGGEIQTDDAQPWLDKNNVEMDQEVAKMTENVLRHQAGVTLLSTRKQMFKTALRTS